MSIMLNFRNCELGKVSQGAKLISCTQWGVCDGKVTGRHKKPHFCRPRVPAQAQMESPVYKLVQAVGEDASRPDKDVGPLH